MIKLGNGFYAERLPDGSVKLGCEVRDGSGHVASVAETEIPAASWCSLVAGLSAAGKTTANRTAAKKLHGVS